MPHAHHSHNQKPLAARVYDSLRQLLADETSPYLAEGRFVLQKDAFIRLSDDDIESDSPFLSYEHTEMTTDEALDFSLYCLRDYFILDIGPASISLAYEAFGHDSTKFETMTEEEALDVKPEVIARNLLKTIKMLLNGQLAVGCTWRDGEFLAGEVFLQGLEPHPVCLIVIDNFTLRRRSGLDYSVKQNHLLDERVKVTKAYPLLPETVAGKRVFPGRTVDSIHDLEPLTKKQVDALKAEADLKLLSGKDAPSKPWVFFYTSVEFWVTAIVVAALFSYLRLSPDTPAIFRSEFATPVMILISWTIVPLISAVWIGWRKGRKFRKELQK